MQLMSLASKDKLRPHLEAAFAVAAMFAALCGGASAQTAVVTVESAGTPTPPKKCGPANGGNMICVTPEPIATQASPDGSVAIQWDLKSTGWTFVKNKGISIHPMNVWRVNEKMPTQYTATMKKKDGVLYKYEINVTNGTATLPPWDPTIQN